MVFLIARAKAAALLPQVKEPSVLICSDQVIRCNGEVREKPVDEEEARRFLKSYRTYPAECINGVVVYNTETGTVILFHLIALLLCYSNFFLALMAGLML